MNKVTIKLILSSFRLVSETKEPVLAWFFCVQLVQRHFKVAYELIELPLWNPFFTSLSINLTEFKFLFKVFLKSLVRSVHFTLMMFGDLCQNFLFLFKPKAHQAGQGLFEFFQFEFKIFFIFVDIIRYFLGFSSKNVFSIMLKLIYLFHGQSIAT